MSKINKLAVIVFIFMLAFTASNGLKAQQSTVWPGTAFMVAGDLWESFLTQNAGVNSKETGTAADKGLRIFARIGNFNREWKEPGANYPNAFTNELWFWRYMYSFAYDPSATFCPKMIDGKANPSYYANAADPTGNFANYATMTYKSSLTGESVKKEAYWVDPAKRNHLVYEASWPTNLGINVKVRAHQFAAPNWNNLNDFVILEMSFKNTGNLDMNMDGTPEKTNNKIQAFSMAVYGEYHPATSNDIGGARSANYGGQYAGSARNIGYIGDPDPDGSPWAITGAFLGALTPPPVAAGKNDLGLLAPTSFGAYIDTWQGWSFIAAKKGGFPASVAAGTGKSADKPLMWGTPAVGTGTQRGWFLSSGTGRGLGFGSILDFPKLMFTTSVGTYYKNGGKTNNVVDLDLSPNPNFFASGTREDLTTWVPKSLTPTAAERPNGDRKLLSEELADPTKAFYSSYEDGSASSTTKYPTGFGKLSKGFMNTFDYEGELFQSIGPFSLDVNEEMTITLMFVSGFRLEGMQKSARAGRWAYENDYVIPEPPPVPDMKVGNTDKATVLLQWDNKAETDAAFAGYKIWKSSQFKKYNWLDDGFRLIDKYQEQMTVGEDKANYRKPVNPKFDNYAKVAAAGLKGQYSGYTWGTWELTKVIPKADAPNYKTAGTYVPSTGYAYVFEDKNVVAGFNYWYYISAYKEGTFTAAGETTTRIETHSLNRNGATGLWTGTFPYATSNAYYPLATETTKLKAIGAVQTVYSALVTYGDLNSGKLKVGVKPNPYKRAALHDNFMQPYDHKVLFYNLPPKAKITITDVAGKLIDIINFESADPNKGATFWNMFSKDGMEIASGLYLYYVEWSGGIAKGKFSVLK